MVWVRGGGGGRGPDQIDDDGRSSSVVVGSPWREDAILYDVKDVFVFNSRTIHRGHLLWYGGLHGISYRDSGQEGGNGEALGQCHCPRFDL